MSLLRRLVNKIELIPSIKCFSTLSSSIEKNFLLLAQNQTKCVAQQESVNSKVLVNYDQTRDYKVRTRLRKRCKSCFFVWRNGRLYVECKEHPRHKQHHKDSLLKGYDNIPHGYHVPNV